MSLFGVGVSVGEQPGSAAKIVIRIGGHNALQIRHSSGEVAHFYGADGSAIKRVGRIGARGNCAIVAFPRPGKVAIFHVQIGEFLVIAG